MSKVLRVFRADASGQVHEERLNTVTGQSRPVEVAQDERERRRQKSREARQGAVRLVQAAEQLVGSASR